MWKLAGLTVAIMFVAGSFYGGAAQVMPGGPGGIEVTRIGFGATRVADPVASISAQEAIDIALERGAEIKAEREKQGAAVSALPTAEELFGGDMAAPVAEPAAVASGAAPVDGSKWRVTGDRVNLRSGPGTGFEIVASAVRGEDVVLQGRDGDWAEVILPETGAKAWIFGKFLVPADG
jgi:uncharacterized protein YgiM (DUF1202 family)